MKTLLTGLATLWCCATGHAQQPEKDYFFVHLQHVANQDIDQGFHGDAYPDNHLGSLPRGEQTLDGITFFIGDKLIQLRGMNVPQFPLEVEELEIDLPVARIHFLHACGWYTVEGENIGAYTIHYDDQSTATIPIIYGEDVRDWWEPAGENKNVSRGKKAWEGTNESAESMDNKIRLYRATWENPHPEKDVVSISYSSTNTTVAAPFCVAITAELP